MATEVFNRADFPFTAVVFVEARFADGSRTSGSAAVVGQNDILTAAHVVYDPDRGGWATEMNFYAGADYNQRLGRFDAHGTDLGAWQGQTFAWIDDTFADFDNESLTFAETQFDVALVGLNAALGNVTGWFGMSTEFDGPQFALSAGYPEGSTGMMLAQPFITREPGFHVYTSSSDLMGRGSSGGPLYVISGGQNYLIGIKSSGNEGVSNHWADVGHLFDELVAQMNANDSLLGSDDFPTGATGSVSAWGSTSGRVNYRGDVDYHAISLLAGVTYVFELNATSGGFDPVLRLRNEAGAVLAVNDDGAGVNSLIQHTVLTSGTYSLAADGGFTTIGNYALTVSVTSTEGADIMPGSTRNDTLSGRGGNDHIQGFAGNDVLQGGLGNDTLDGGAGTDVAVLEGARASYSFLLDSGALRAIADGSGEVDRLIAIETVRFAGGVDVPISALMPNVASPGNDVLNGTANADSIDGAGGNDQISGLAGDDVLGGGAGNDMLDGGIGDDTLGGGPGNDTFIVDSVLDQVVESANHGTDLVKTALAAYTLAANVEQLLYTGTGAFSGTGNAHANKITGAAGNDTLLGLGGADTLIGNAGNDTLDGGAGADRMEGGAGNDTYVVDQGVGDTVVDTDGTDTVQSSATYALGATIENLVLTGSLNGDGTGNAANNFITGNAGNNVLSGGGGDDTFFASGGNDRFVGGAGNDTLNLASSPFTFAQKGLAGGFSVARPNATTILITDVDTNQKFTVTGAWGAASGDRGIESYVFSDRAATLAELIANTASAFVDNYAGTAAAETFDGLAGNDLINGGGGNDQLTGGAGNDALDGGAGNDVLAGGLGDDTYVVDSLQDQVVELAGQGADTIRTALSSYTLGDKPEVERLEFTGAGAFNGTGNTRANTLKGGAGNDTLDGGTGVDRMEGGAGSDTYVVDRAATNVVNPDGTVSTILGDTVVDTDGTADTVRSSVSYTLGATIENLALTGNLNTNGAGNAANNSIVGNAGNNTLSGGGGNDVLAGGAGRDRLTGGAGNDTFVFDSLLNALTNVDTITDFASSPDQIRLDNDVFLGLSAGVLGTGALRAAPGATAAADADDRIIYNTATGALYFDADGAGGAAAIQFAVLATRPIITTGDFEIV